MSCVESELLCSSRDVAFPSCGVLLSARVVLGGVENPIWSSVAVAALYQHMCSACSGAEAVMIAFARRNVSMMRMQYCRVDS